MRKDKKEKLEDMVIGFILTLLIISLIFFITGCGSKEETIKCLGGNLYNVVPNTSYVLIRKGCTGE